MPTRTQIGEAEIWVRFAEAALSTGENTPTEAASLADATLDEFNRRFEWYEGGYGYFWQYRPKPLEKVKR